MMRPVSTTQKGNEDIMQSTDYSVKDRFLESYQNHIAAMQIVSECAKIYVLKNYKKVKDWSDLEVVMEDANTLDGPLNKANGGKPLTDFIEYYKYVDKESTKGFSSYTKRSDVLSSMLDKMDEADKLRHNPAKTVTNVVLDTSDGDFSLKINGRSHMWISDSTVILIANYIERQINKQKK